MAIEISEYQRNTAFLGVILISLASFVYMMSFLRTVLIPLIWAAFFAMPLTLLITAIDSGIVWLMSCIIHRKASALVVNGEQVEPLELTETVQFTAVMGESNIRMMHTPAVAAFLNKVNKPCDRKLPAFILQCFRRRVTLVSLDIDREECGADAELGPEVNRLVRGWDYYIADPSDHAPPAITSAIVTSLHINHQEAQPQELSVGLFLDHAGQYPAVLPGDRVEQGIKLSGTLAMNKHSSVSWAFALTAAVIIVAAGVGSFFWMVSIGITLLIQNLHVYEQGARDIIDALKPLLPPDIWNDLQDKLKDFASHGLPDLASSLVSNLENIAIQFVFFMVYLLFWIFEPLPVSGPVMQVFKSYLLLKTMVCLLFAFLMSLLLAILKCNLWPLFFSINFLLNYIPEVGAMACAILMTPAILLNGDLEVKARLYNFAWLAIGGIIIKVITGNVIEVRLYATKGGQFMRMHPVMLLALMLVCTALLGVTGAFLSVPIMAAVKYNLLCANVPDWYLNPLLVAIEGDEKGPHRNFVDRRRSTTGLPSESSKTERTRTQWLQRFCPAFFNRRLPTQMSIVGVRSDVLLTPTGTPTE